MSKRLVGVLAGLVLLGAALVVRAEPNGFDDLMRWGGGGARDRGVVVDHPPRGDGGASSDTAYYYEQPPFESWQELADDFVLASPATIRRVGWWGFYHMDTDPPTPETMRIRFHDSRPADGLPGEILYEESFLNTSRTATGRIVYGAGGFPDEYLYQADLATPLDLAAGVKYWFEFVQVGDLDSTFRVEYSEVERTGFAFRNNWVSDWRHASTVDVAFQISTVPEPACLGVLVLAAIGAYRGKRRRCRGQTPFRSRR